MEECEHSLCFRNQSRHDFRHSSISINQSIMLNRIFALPIIKSPAVAAAGTAVATPISASVTATSSLSQLFRSSFVANSQKSRTLSAASTPSSVSSSRATATATPAATWTSICSSFTSSPRSFSSSTSPAAPTSTSTSSSSSPAPSASVSPSSASPSSSSSSSDRRILGELLHHNLDLSEAYIGQIIEVPYEQTVGESQQCLWFSTFQCHDRLYTSTPFAQSLALHSHVLPFSLVLFNTISMAHVDETRSVLDLGYENAVYVRPGFPGDTLKQVFTIKHLRNTSDEKSTIVKVGCELFNQKSQLIFSVDKIMLYPMITNPYKLSVAPTHPAPPPTSHLLAHILYNADSLPRNAGLATLRANQLILHSVSRPIGVNMNMSLSTLFRWTHPSIFNLNKHVDSELLVPGGLVLAATLAASSRGLFECLHEQVESCSFINKVNPTDMIGALSYIASVKSLKEGFEEVRITTLGVKNIDVALDLKSVPIPVQLFTDKKMRPTQVEAFLEKECPILKDKIVVEVHRKIVRQSPYSQHRQIPLL